MIRHKVVIHPLRISRPFQFPWAFRADWILQWLQHASFSRKTSDSNRKNYCKVGMLRISVLDNLAVVVTGSNRKCGLKLQDRILWSCSNWSFSTILWSTMIWCCTQHDVRGVQHVSCSWFIEQLTETAPSCSKAPNWASVKITLVLFCRCNNNLIILFYWLLLSIWYQKLWLLHSWISTLDFKRKQQDNIWL